MCILLLRQGGLLPQVDPSKLLPSVAVPIHYNEHPCIARNSTRNFPLSMLSHLLQICCCFEAYAGSHWLWHTASALSEDLLAEHTQFLPSMVSLHMLHQSHSIGKALSTVGTLFNSCSPETRCETLFLKGWAEAGVACAAALFLIPKLKDVFAYNVICTRQMCSTDVSSS